MTVEIPFDEPDTLEELIGVLSVALKTDDLSPEQRVIVDRMLTEIHENSDVDPDDEHVDPDVSFDTES